MPETLAHYRDIVEVLAAVEEYLADRADTIDGEDGVPVSNRAMQLLEQVWQVQRAIRTMK